MSESNDSGQQLPAADSNAAEDDVAQGLSQKLGSVDEDDNGVVGDKGRVPEDAGSGKEDNFEDCPDDILGDEVERLRALLDEKESSTQQFEEERVAFVREVGSLRFRIKALADQQLLVVENGDVRYEEGGENGEKSLVTERGTRWIELVKECNGFVEKALERQTQTEARVRELDGIVSMKDQEIEGLNGNVRVLYESQLEREAYYGDVTNRMLASLGGLVDQQEVVDDSIAGKLVHVEKGTSMLTEKFNVMLSEIDQLRQCLPDSRFDLSSQDIGGIFAAARNDLLELKRKEAEFVERLSYLEDENKKHVVELDNQREMAERLNAELGQMKTELEQEKNRCANTREKLTMAVTKGKGLVHQRDSLKQSLAEKMSELEKCRIELQEKSNALEAAEMSKEELIRSESSVASLQEILSQNNVILQKLEEMLSQNGVPEELQSLDIGERLQWLVDESDKLRSISKEFQTLKNALYAIDLPEVISSSSLESQVNWLRESYSQVNEELLMLRDEINATKEMARKNIEELSNSLSAELQAKEYLQAELDDLTSKNKQVIKKEHQLSIEKAEMVRMLLDVAGIVVDKEEIDQLSSDFTRLIDTCISKIKEQSSASFDNLTASLSAEMQAKEYLQVELDNLTSMYKEIIEKEHQASSDKNQMIKLLLDVSGIVMDNEDASQLSADVATLIDTCIGKIKEQSSASFDHLTASVSAETQAKEYIQVKLDNLTSKYNEILEKECQGSSEKAEMIKMLLDVSGVVIDNEDASLLSSDIPTLVERCSQKIKEQSISTFDSPCIDAEQFETIQSQLYVRDQELMLCQSILEEDRLVKSEVENLSKELQEVSQELEALKEEKRSLQRDIERSEEKNAMIRDKLSMAVKKGKGMVQERENLKIRLEEKNSEIERLRIELQQEQFALSECRDKISSYSADLDRIPKLEADLVAMKEQRDRFEQLLLESNNMLQRVIKAIDEIALPFDSVSEEPLGKVNWLAGYINECQDAEAKAKQELGEVQEETSNMGLKLEEAQSTIKSLENELLVVQNSLSQIAEEKREIEVVKINVEKELKRALEEAVSQASELDKVCAAKKSLEEALSLAENNISALVSETEGVLVSKAAADNELGRVKEEVDIQTSKLTEAYKTIQSLEDTLSQVQANVSLLTEQNNDAQIGRSNLEAELKKLQEEARLQDNKLADASATVESLKDALLKAGNDISELENDKKNAEGEILALNSKLNATIEELSGTQGSKESRSLELTGHLNNLQLLMRDETMLSTMKRCFEKKFESLKDMDLILKKIRDCCVSVGLPELHSHQVLEENSYVAKSFSYVFDSIDSVKKGNGEVNVAVGDDMPSMFKSTVEGLHLRDRILSQNFESFSSFIDELVESLSSNLQARSDEIASMFDHMESLKQRAYNLEIYGQEQENTKAILENDLKFLVSACTDATRDLKFDVENNLLELISVPEFEELRHNLSQQTGGSGEHTTETHEQGLDGSRYGKTAEMLSVASRNVQALIKQFVITSEVAASTIKDLQNEREEARTISAKAIEESDLRQTRISKLEADVEALERSCAQLTHKLEDYQGKEDTLKEKEAELSSLYNTSMKNRGDEDLLLSASDVKILFDKIKGIEVPMPESRVGDLEPCSSTDVEKLFHIIDNIGGFQNQIKLLSSAKEELQSILGTRELEIEHLQEEVENYVRDRQDTEKMKNELSALVSGLEKIIDISGGNSLVGEQKSAGVKGLVSALENQVMALLLESKNSKSKAQELGTKLVESQKAVDELSTKVNLLEDSAQGRTTAQPEIVQERSIFEAPGSEISEIEDVGSHGSKPISPVPSAAHVRTMRKGSNDHLAIDIDSESTRLISSQETDEDKGHVFKSLNASGFIPRQGKLIADRIDGIWVSGGRVLMSRPRARLGLIAYWLVLHLWLLGAIL